MLLRFLCSGASLSILTELVDPVIGHLKSDHRMGRNFLASAEGDANNALLAAIGYNFSLLLNWLWRLLCAFFLAMFAMIATAQPSPQSA